MKINILKIISISLNSLVSIILLLIVRIFFVNALFSSGKYHVFAIAFSYSVFIPWLIISILNINSWIGIKKGNYKFGIIFSLTFLILFALILAEIHVIVNPFPYLFQ